jgi:hypothetical protein
MKTYIAEELRNWQEINGSVSNITQTDLQDLFRCITPNNDPFPGGNYQIDVTAIQHLAKFEKAYDLNPVRVARIILAHLLLD